MNTIVTMTLEEIRNTPLSRDEIEAIRIAATSAARGLAAEDPECPVQTKEQLKQFRPLENVLPALYAALHPDQTEREVQMARALCLA